MARTSAISEEVWANAIHAVMVEKMSLRTAAQKFGVHHMSLHRRIKDLRGDKKPSEKQARAAASAAAGYPQPPPGMSMVNMMHMSMDKPVGNPGMKPQAAPHMGYRGPAPPMNYMPPPPMMMRQPFAGVENASGNVSNWSKAVQAVEAGHMDVLQAANAFKVDAHTLHDHLTSKRNAGEEYLRPNDEHGILKVVLSRAELGVKMTYEEVVDLLRRVQFKYGSPSGGGANPNAFKQTVSMFVQRNENLLRSTLEGMAEQPPSPSAHEYAYRYAPQQQNLAHMGPRPGLQQADIYEESKPAHAASSYGQEQRTYSPSSNLLIASNKISVEKTSEAYQQRPRRPADEPAPPQSSESKAKEVDDVVEV